MLVPTSPSFRNLAATAILLAWMASLGWLGLRQLDRTEAATLSTEASLRLAPGSIWFAVYAGQTQVGTAGIRVDTLSPGYRIDESFSLELPAHGGLVRTTRRTDVSLGATLNLQRLHSHQTRDGVQADWVIALLGDTVNAHLVSSSGMTHGLAHLAEVPATVLTLPFRLALGGDLAPGRTRTVTLMDGWPIGGRPARVTIGPPRELRFVDSSDIDSDSLHTVAAHTDSARVFAVTIDAANGPVRLWIDGRGSVSALETLFGVHWTRTVFELSETEFRKTLGARTAAITAVLPRLAPFAADPMDRDTVTTPRRFLVTHRDHSPVDRALLAMLAGGRQGVQGDTLTIYDRPVTTQGESAVDTTSDPMIQAAGAIATLQRRLLPAPFSRDQLPALLLAYRRLIHVDTAAAAPVDALSTLGRGAGAPDGVARLFVAMLRAAGVPARLAIGVYARDTTMLTHAWAEIWSRRSGGWYAVDPVTGTASANTGLIRLAFAGSSHPDDLMALVANARLIELGRKEHR